MNFKELIEDFQRLPSTTQVAFIAFMLGIVVLLVLFPSAGTSIITFLLALQMLVTK